MLLFLRGPDRRRLYSGRAGSGGQPGIIQPAPLCARKPRSGPRARQRVSRVRFPWRLAGLTILPMEVLRMRCVIFAVGLLLVSAAQGQTPQPTSFDIDECGVLVQEGGCALFSGGGGKFVVVDTGRFGFGDSVRVVGTVDTNCTTICSTADGCIRGATLYDPAILPCGTALPNFPGDIVTGACSSLGTTLLVATVTGLWLSRRSSRGPTSL
jgi:hypothetical protein